MSKSFFARFLIIGALALCAVLWLLSVVIPDSFGWFSLALAVLIFCLAAGAVYVLKALGFFGPRLPKVDLMFAAAFLIIAVFALVSLVAIPENTVLPLIAVIVTGLLLIGLLATGGKRWDEGDNHKVGYKNYEQRKAEEEKQNKK